MTWSFKFDGLKPSESSVMWEELSKNLYSWQSLLIRPT